MIVSVAKILEAFMYVLLVFVIIPFAVLGVVLAIAALILLAAAALEFPWLLLGALGLGVLMLNLPKLSKGRELSCQQI